MLGLLPELIEQMGFPTMMYNPLQRSPDSHNARSSQAR